MLDYSTFEIRHSPFESFVAFLAVFLEAIVIEMSSLASFHIGVMGSRHSSDMPTNSSSQNMV